jgi:hypothetical protein
MLSLTCFQRLAKNKKQITPNVAYFFICLMRLYDLRRYRIIPVRHSWDLFGMDPQRVKRYLRALVNARVLEVSSMRVAGGYRLNLDCQASHCMIQQWIRDSNAARERIQLVDREVPEDPDDLRQWLLTGKAPRRSKSDRG